MASIATVCPRARSVASTTVRLRDIWRCERLQLRTSAPARRPTSTAPRPRRCAAAERNITSSSAARYAASTLAKDSPTSQTFAPSTANLRAARKSIDEILASDQPPSEDEVAKVLLACQHAPILTSGKTSSKSPTSALLSLGSSPEAVTATPPSVLPGATNGTADALMNLAYKLISHPPVFITKKILKAYLDSAVALRRPESLPLVFELYAKKPFPDLSRRRKPPTGASSPPSPPYKTPNPSAISATIPTSIANLALDAAISRRNLDLCIALIDTTFRSPAFLRSKLLLKAGPILAAATITPPALYLIAANLGQISTTNMDPATLSTVIFAGAMTYVTVLGSLGFVTIATANDQMKRVSWAPGTRLRERWMREEERAALDKVACAWGFKNENRRGEEEGEEWEGLREWIGVRGMILDKVDLMPGMQ